MRSMRARRARIASEHWPEQLPDSQGRREAEEAKGVFVYADIAPTCRFDHLEPVLD